MRDSAAFLYGESLFTTTRAKRGRMFFANEHVNRLTIGIERYYLARPLTGKERDELAGKVSAHVSTLPEGEHRFRVSVHAGERESLVKKEFDFEELIFHFSHSELGPDNGALSLKSFPSPFSSSYCDIYPNMKMGSYMPLLYLKMEAMRSGSDDALLYNEAGYAIEASTSNLFFIKGDKLYSPRKGVLDGIVKEAMMEMFPVEQADICLSEINTFDGAILSNSVWGLKNVKAIDGMHFKKLNETLVQDMLKRILKRGYGEA